MPAVDGLSGEDTVIVDDERGLDVSQQRLHLRQFPEETVRRILEDEGAVVVHGVNVPNSIK